MGSIHDFQSELRMASLVVFVKIESQHQGTFVRHCLTKATAYLMDSAHSQASASLQHS